MEFTKKELMILKAALIESQIRMSFEAQYLGLLELDQRNISKIVSEVNELSLRFTQYKRENFPEPDEE